MSRRSLVFLGCFGLAVSATLGLWAWFLADKSLDVADHWSSILSSFAAILGLAISVVALRSASGDQHGLGTRKTYVRGRIDHRRAERRRLFADHIEGQLRRLAEKEEWRDHRYAELEAEVEIEEQSSQYMIARLLLPRRGSRLRRVKSLSRALHRINERLVILEGDPGSGKSVALRHLAQSLATKAMRKASEHSVIPLYINLRELKLLDGTVTSSDIRAFVLHSINRGNSRDVDRFLDDEFERGAQEGTWLFLFDSFDEIPQVLSATEAGPVVEAYADAIFNFLHEMNVSRGIVASRQFRGPASALSWPRFTIVPLSSRRKRDLIRRADLDRHSESTLIDELGGGTSALPELTDNPMFLGLLCEHVRTHKAIPSSVHVAIESYVSLRLTRDRTRIAERFGLDTVYIRKAAEELAFRLALHGTQGLNPERAVAVALLCENSEFDGDHVNAALDALEYVKIIKGTESSSSTAVAGGEIAFAHRRLQEYFATCVVMRESNRIPTHSLLSDGRWRETAVTILQTQTVESIDPFLQLILDQLNKDPSSQSAPPTERNTFDWPSGTLHVLDIVSAGLGRNTSRVKPELSRRIGELLKRAWDSGLRFDRKWALEFCAAADPSTAVTMVREAFSGNSGWLRQEAFRQVRRLGEVAETLSTEIRQALLDLATGGDLRKDRVSVRAQIRRLPNPTPLVHSASLLLVAPIVDLLAPITILAASALSSITSLTWADLTVQAIFLALYAVGLPSFRFFFASKSRRSALINRWHLRIVLGGSVEAWIFIVFSASLLLRVALVLSADMSWLRAILTYVVLWPFAAHFAVLRGRFVTYSHWLFVPLLLILELISMTLRGAMRMVRNLFSMAALNLLLLLILVIIGVTIVGTAANALAVYVIVPVASLLNIDPPVVTIRWLWTLLAIFGLYMLLQAAGILRHRILDLRTSRLTQDEVALGLPREALLGKLVKLESDWGVLNLMRQVRRSRAIRTHDAATCLVTYAAWLEGYDHYVKSHSPQFESAVDVWKFLTHGLRDGRKSPIARLRKMLRDARGETAKEDWLRESGLQTLLNGHPGIGEAVKPWRCDDPDTIDEINRAIEEIKRSYAGSARSASRVPDKFVV